MSDQTAPSMTTRLFPGKQFISTILDALDTKHQMSARLWKVYLMRAAMAGVIISIFYLASFAIEAGFDSVPAGAATLRPIGFLLGSLIFGFALVFIYFTKSELLTSNMMIVSIGAYYRKTSLKRASKLLGMCYLGNFLGGLFMAVLLLGSTLLSGSLGETMGVAVEHKIEYITEGPAGWSDLFIRAILCNFLINLAMLLCYNGMLHEDISKITTMVVAVFLFAYLGLQHSVANTALFLMYGFQYGVDVPAAIANVVIALVGNFIGGGILIGVYYAYANDYRRAQRKGRVPEEG